MRLTKNMKKILDEIIEKNDNPIAVTFFVSDLNNEYMLSDLDVEDILSALERQGAIEYLDIKCETFRLTEEGRRYKEIKRLELKEFLLKSVVVPIGVAFITSLLISLLLPQ